MSCKVFLKKRVCAYLCTCVGCLVREQTRGPEQSPSSSIGCFIRLMSNREQQTSITSCAAKQHGPAGSGASSHSERPISQIPTAIYWQSIAHNSTGSLSLQATKLHGKEHMEISFHVGLFKTSPLKSTHFFSVIRGGGCISITQSCHVSTLLFS